MKNFERPTKFAIITEPFSAENQMLTPKMSLRRNNILKRYAPLIEDIYELKTGSTVSVNAMEDSS